MGHRCRRHVRNPLTQQLPATYQRMERSGDSVAMLRDDKAGRNGSVELTSSSSGPLSQQVFETLPKCYPFVNFAHFHIILIPKHTSIPKTTRLRGVTTPL